jgi:hypothetical protein
MLLRGVHHHVDLLCARGNRGWLTYVGVFGVKMTVGSGG